jgi:hypothetical protein
VLSAFPSATVETSGTVESAIGRSRSEQMAAIGRCPPPPRERADLMNALHVGLPTRNVDYTLPCDPAVSCNRGDDRVRPRRRSLLVTVETSGTIWGANRRSHSEQVAAIGRCLPSLRQRAAAVTVLGVWSTDDKIHSLFPRPPFLPDTGNDGRRPWAAAISLPLRRLAPTRVPFVEAVASRCRPPVGALRPRSSEQRTAYPFLLSIIPCPVPVSRYFWNTRHRLAPTRAPLPWGGVAPVGVPLVEAIASRWRPSVGALRPHIREQRL